MILKCSSKTKPAALGTYILKNIQKEDVKIKCIGAGAINQTMKAIAFANEKGTGVLIGAFPFIKEEIIDEQDRRIIIIELYDLNGE
ncbi:MAG: stage V sporulation protein S [Prevotella sp.]|nr:stage V sporulation protein S [Staphylococcus sp.]MCM1349916.1 stage V sporulation protein S [Prevotella sp.]